jgi:hypothetical protein
MLLEGHFEFGLSWSGDRSGVLMGTGALQHEGFGFWFFFLGRGTRGPDSQVFAAFYTTVRSKE